MGLIDEEYEKPAKAPTQRSSALTGLGALRGLSKYKTITAKYNEKHQAKNPTVEHGRGTIDKTLSHLTDTKQTLNVTLSDSSSTKQKLESGPLSHLTDTKQSLNDKNSATSVKSLNNSLSDLTSAKRISNNEIKGSNQSETSFEQTPPESLNSSAVDSDINTCKQTIDTVKSLNGQSAFNELPLDQTNSTVVKSLNIELSHLTTNAGDQPNNPLEKQNKELVTKQLLNNTDDQPGVKSLNTELSHLTDSPKNASDQQNISKSLNKSLSDLPSIERPPTANKINDTLTLNTERNPLISEQVSTKKKTRVHQQHDSDALTNTESLNSHLTDTKRSLNQPLNSHQTDTKQPLNSDLTSHLTDTKRSLNGYLTPKGIFQRSATQRMILITLFHLINDKTRSERGWTQYFYSKGLWAVIKDKPSAPKTPESFYVLMSRMTCPVHNLHNDKKSDYCIISDSKAGEGGYARYALTTEMYDSIREAILAGFIQVDTKQSLNSDLTSHLTSHLTNVPRGGGFNNNISSSNTNTDEPIIKWTTTTLPTEWKQVAIPESLRLKGVGEDILLQLANRGYCSPDKAKQYLAWCAWDFENNKRPRINDWRAYFMGCMAQDRCYPRPVDYKTPQEIEEEAELNALRAAKQKAAERAKEREALERELLMAKFDEWYPTLSSTELDALSPHLRSGMRREYIFSRFVDTFKTRVLKDFGCSAKTLRVEEILSGSNNSAENEREEIRHQIETSLAKEKP